MLILLCSLVAALGLVVTGFYVAGNGVGVGALALATLPVLSMLGPYAAVRRSRRAVGVALALLGLDVAYAAWRIAEVRPDPRYVLCVDGTCGAHASWLGRLVREDETAYAGVALSRGLGALSAEELDVIEPAVREVYGALAAERATPGPNALTFASSAERVESLVYLPPGDGKVPALVFLHGFGGLLTSYLSVLAASPLGERYAIVAPALDMGGAWWEPPGRDVLSRTLDTLPPRVDRDALWLVGLSNGAIGANRLAADPALGPRFRGTILLVGGYQPERAPVPHGPVLLVPGIDDPRFPIAWLEAAAAAMRDAGVDVRWAPVKGDHFILFTDPEEVTGHMARWLAEQEGPTEERPGL